MVVVRLARAAEVSRAWRSAAGSDVVWRSGAEWSLRQRFPLLAAMKAWGGCTASWKELCVRYIRATAECDDVIARNTPSTTAPCRRSQYLVGLTVEQQRRIPPSASESAVLLSTLVGVSEPHLSYELDPGSRSSRDCLAIAECPVESRPVFAWSDLNDHDWLNERSTVAQARERIAMASLRVSVMLTRKRDGKLCQLGTTTYVATNNTASSDNRSRAEAGAVRSSVRCAGPFVVPSMLEGQQQLGDPPEPWIGALDVTMRVKFLPGELCECPPEEFDLDDDDERPMEIMCRCGCEPCWSLEGVDVFLDKDPDDNRHLLSLELFGLAASSPSRPKVIAVDDVLRVLESPAATHRWV